MLDTLARRLGLRTDPAIFFTAAGLMVAFLVLLLIFPEGIGDLFTAGRTWVVTRLGWFFILGVSVWVLFLVYLALSKFGNVRLGGDHERPRYSNVSWFTMLFAGGIGTILMYWGVAEPINHFASAPRGAVPFSAEAANDAMSIAIYHLGLHTWAIFTLPGLAFGYFIYRHKLPLRVSSVFYPFLKERIHGPIGKAIDVFAILGTLFGVAVSIGLGTQQINTGLSALTSIPNAVVPKVVIIGILTTIAVTSIVMGLDKGVKTLSNVNIGMAVALMLFVLFAGSTVFLLREIIETIGLYAQNLVPLAFWNDALAPYTSEEGWGWQAGWTVFYWAWTVTWAPFMGIFLARISRGRTIREFVGGVLVAPSLFTLVWFVIFGWSAMELDGIGSSPDDPHPITAAVLEDPATAMFTFFDQLLGVGGLSTLISGLVVVIVAIFFATSSDSASLVVDMLCTGTEDPGPVRQRVFWGVSEGAVAVALIVLAGEAGLVALQQVITVVGLPIFLLMFLAMFALWRGLRSESFVTVRLPVSGAKADTPQPEVNGTRTRLSRSAARLARRSGRG
ncbi:BCCT family transporter [Promicromonospora citrea]|uniref:Multidrug DMT transporter permease n=1 Tax=Promicromonospora citrea TaxID=43677 RepID=A0A8H9GG71_9MICO|nr:BCCT family transporter [Promicromonospora citrea]GGM18418.1 multidrug DMT transporter permease [Promicromonospora citrea]